MECPICGKELQIADKKLINMDRYDNGAKVRADCCGGLLDMVPTRRLQGIGSTRPDEEGRLGRLNKLNYTELKLSKKYIY